MFAHASESKEPSRWAAVAVNEAAAELGRHRLLRPGHTCWRIERATRVKVLVDADEYFRMLYRCLLAARSSIHILGWDLDSRVVLEHDPHARDPALPSTLGPLLGALARRHPSLHVYVLAWDFAPIYLFEREALPRLKFGLRTPKRVRFRLDDQHPPGASQHEKLVVVDDTIAFSGGLDLCDVRWDTPEHRADDPRRVDVHGQIYRPHHDVQVAVQGDVARALGELARERWRVATGERLAPAERPHEDGDPWPWAFTPELEHVDVGIARTVPSRRSEPGIHEVESLWERSIASARSHIYIENPYVTTERIEAALTARLREPGGPDVVLVHPPRSNGFLENFFLRSLVDDLVLRLRAADEYGRLAVLCPFVASGTAAPPVGVNVHGKVCIVDDRLLRIGSANLTSRSFRLDRECDLAIEADSETTARAIAELRSRLVGEHLGQPAEAVTRELDACGSLTFAIAALARQGSGERMLVDYAPAEAHMVDRQSPIRGVIDPGEPLSLQQIGNLLKHDEGERASRWNVIGVLWWVATLAFVVAAKLGGWIELDDLTSWLERGAAHPAQAWPHVVAVFVIGGLLLVPVTLLIANCGLLFGPKLGLAYGLLGAFLGAAVYYGLGRWLGRDLVYRFAGPRLRHVAKAAARKGILAVATLRLVPLAPHVVVGLIAGAARITFRDYMFGTIVAMTPGAVVLVLIGARLSYGGDWRTALISVALLVAVGLGVAWILQRLLGSREPDESSRGPPA